MTFVNGDLVIPTLQYPAPWNFTLALRPFPALPPAPIKEITYEPAYDSEGNVIGVRTMPIPSEAPVMITDSNQYRQVLPKPWALVNGQQLLQVPLPAGVVPVHTAPVGLLQLNPIPQDQNTSDSSQSQGSNSDDDLFVQQDDNTRQN